jgi:hypothetical protein
MKQRDITPYNILKKIVQGKVVFDKGKPSENTNSNNSVCSIASCEMNPNFSQFSSTTSTSSMTSDTKMSSLFHGNTYIYGGTFNFNNPESSLWAILSKFCLTKS